MANPVRIYVLHHPESEAGRILTDHIYEWFRLPSLEGIPVYVRSAPAKDSATPCEIADSPGVLNYLILLVDAHMVRDMAWQQYLDRLARQCQETGRSSSATGLGRSVPTHGLVMFPVAMDTTATNLPPSVAHRNFIRHRHGSGPGDPASREDTLKHLTEALSRDLNGRVFPEQAGGKLKIFISYARADGTDAPKRIRDYIQSQTQCAAFFDENDIGYGTGFAKVLAEDAGEQARALIVIRGDNYADRPWCRWELSRYLRPRDVALFPQEPGVSAPPGAGACVGVFHPVLVVDALEQARLTREIPELGQAPTLRWSPGREQLCFSMLLREVLLGARNVLAAREDAQRAEERDQSTQSPGMRLPPTEHQLWLNRMPGPLALHAFIAEQERKLGGQRIAQINYGGNGLPLMELRLLELTFPTIHFRAFHDVREQLPGQIRKSCRAGQKSDATGSEPPPTAPLAGRVLVISSSASRDLPSLGYLDRHLREMLIYLLRPLISLGADVMYGGSPPKAAGGGAGDPSNITTTLLGLISDERNATRMGETGGDPSEHKPTASRLFNPLQWPECLQITPEDEAAWVNVCSIRTINPQAAQLPPCADESQIPPEQEPSARFLATRALVHAFLRQQTARGFQCPVPGSPKRQVEPAAYVLIGGKLDGFGGLMPGVFEEFLQAVRHQRPIYLVGGLGGAAKKLAQVLLAAPSRRIPRPPEFTKSHHVRSPESPNYGRMLKGLKDLGKEVRDPSRQHRADEAFDALWDLLRRAAETADGPAALLRNGLSRAENQTLLQTEGTTEAVHLIWHGLDRVLLGNHPPRPVTRRSRK